MSIIIFLLKYALPFLTKIVKNICVNRSLPFYNGVCHIPYGYCCSIRHPRGFSLKIRLLIFLHHRSYMTHFYSLPWPNKSISRSYCTSMVHKGINLKYYHRRTGRLRADMCHKIKLAVQLF